MRMLLITTAIFVFINIADGDILPKQDSLVVESTLTDTLIPAETTLVNPAEADASIQNETVRQAIVLHNRADSLLDCGEYSQARAAYNEALQLKNKLGDTLGEALCRFGLGKIAFYEALYSKSLRYLNAAEPVIGEQFPLDAIAVVVIGGTPFSGGVGGIPQTISGALVIAVLNTVLNLVGLSSYWQVFAKGAVIIVALVFDLILRKYLRRGIT